MEIERARARERERDILGERDCEREGREIGREIKREGEEEGEREMTGMLVESASETLRCYAMMEADSESTVSPCWKQLRIILQNLAYKDVEVIVVTSQIENENQI